MKIPYKNAKSSDEAFKKVETLLTSDMLKQFKIDAKLACDPSARKIKAEGSGFTLNAKFDDTSCEVDLELSFMLRPFKATILAKLEDHLKRAL